MKLNNRGWGLAPMLAICGCLCFCLIISAFKYNKILNTDNTIKVVESNSSKALEKSSSYKKDNDYTLYQQLENNLVEASLKYVSKLTIDTGKIILTDNEIGASNIMLDNCNGYVIVDIGKNSSRAYINCKGIYQTANYNIDFE